MEVKSVVNQDNMMNYLKRISQLEPERIRSSLKKGDIIGRGEKSWYRIDNPDVYKELGNTDAGGSLYILIYKKVKQILKEQKEDQMEAQKSPWFDTTKLLKLFKRDTIPFSKSYKLRLDRSLEKSILLHLMMQEKNECFLINGKIKSDHLELSDLSYNLIFRQDTPYLIDMQNPSRENIEQGYLRPYMNIPLAICDNQFLFSSKTESSRQYSF